MDKHEILKKRMLKLNRHYKALSEYKQLIDQLIEEINLFDIVTFEHLKPNQKAILDAYLQRFGALQDFLGARILPLLMELAGFPVNTTSEVFYYAEKEGIIQSLEGWIELREVRNEIARDYPEDLATAIKDFQYCVNHYSQLQSYFENTLSFAKKFEGQA